MTNIFLYNDKGVIRDDTSSDATTYSSEKIDWLLSQSPIIEGADGEILIKEGNDAVGSGYNVGSFSSIGHSHNSEDITLDVTNFGGNLDASLDTIQKLADYIDDMVLHGITDHGALSGLGDDDHPQYHNNTRGDARYSQLGHTHTKGEVGLGNVDNTSDVNKPVSTAQQSALDTKQNILLEGAFVNGDKTKLDGIDAGAEVNNISDANALDLTDGGATILHKHSYNNLDDKPTIPTQYTDEMAQDAVGTILVDSSEIDFVYDDATPNITATIKSGSIDEAKLDASVNASLDLADSAVQPSSSDILTNKNLTDPSNTFPTFNQDTTGKAGTVETISGKISAGTNVSITGSGTTAAPYVINSSGGGGTFNYGISFAMNKGLTF